MQLLRRHTFASLLSLLLLAGLAAPSVHTLAHLAAEAGASEDGHAAEGASTEDASGPHFEWDCPVCDLAGTLHATAPEAVALAAVLRSAPFAERAPALVVLSSPVRLGARAPPARLGTTAHA